MCPSNYPSVGLSPTFIGQMVPNRKGTREGLLALQLGRGHSRRPVQP